MQTQGLGLNALFGQLGEAQGFAGINANNINDFEAELQKILGQDVDLDGLLQAVQAGQSGGNALPLAGNAGNTLPQGDAVAADSLLAADTETAPESLLDLAGVSAELSTEIRQMLAQTKKQGIEEGSDIDTTLFAAADETPTVLPGVIVDKAGAALGAESMTAADKLRAALNQMRDGTANTMQPGAAAAEDAAATDGEPAIMPEQMRKPVMPNGLVRQGVEPIEAHRIAMAQDAPMPNPIKGAMDSGSNTAMMKPLDAMAMAMQGAATQAMEGMDADNLDPQSWREALQSLSDRMPVLTERAPQVAAARDASAAQILQNPALAGRLQASMAPDIINERIQYMMNAGKQVADIQLDPPELGALQVRVTTQNDQTSVSFMAASAAVRDVLEQQMPKLREFFEQQGIELGDVSVSDQQSQAQQDMMASHDEAAGDDNMMGADNDALPDETDAEIGEKIISQGLVDLFA